MSLLNQTSFPVAVDGEGTPIPQARKYIYHSGTERLCALYSDLDLTVTQNNPIIPDENGVFPPCYLLKGAYRVEVQKSSGAREAIFSEEICIDPGTIAAVKAQFPQKSDLIANETLSYDLGLHSVMASPGEFVETLVDGMTYEVVSADAVDAHLTTAKGVKFYETGTIFSTLERFRLAIQRGVTYDIGAVVTAGAQQYKYLGDGNTDIAGLTGWSMVEAVVDTDVLDQAVTQAESAQAAAEFAALTAGATLFDDLAAGLAATLLGGTFFVGDASGVALYRKDLSGATKLSLVGEALFDSVSELLSSTQVMASGLLLRTREGGFVYKVASSTATDHHLTTAGGTKLYAVPCANGCPIEQFGGAADSGVTDNSIALQAMVDAFGTNGLTAILGNPPGMVATDPNFRMARKRYVFKTKVALPISTRLRLIGENNAVFLHSPATPGEAMLEIQAGYNDGSEFIFENLRGDLVSGEGRFIATVPTGTQRFRRFIMQNCQFKAANYVVDMVTNYTYDPQINDVKIMGERSGFRWRGDTGVSFTTSSATINRLHIATGAGGAATIRGPMLWLEGWGGFSGDGNILEGNTRMDVDDFEMVGGRSVSTLYLKNCSSFRSIAFRAHKELVGLTEAPDADHNGPTDYDIFIDNPAGSNRRDFNIVLGGGLEQVPSGRIRLENASVNQGAVLTLEGGAIDDTSASMVGPVSLVRRNPELSTQSSGSGLWNDPRQRFEGRVARKSSDSNTQMVMLPTPSLQLYDYRGGMPSNPEFPVEIVTHNNGRYTTRFVQNDPVYGPTLLIDTSTGSGYFDIALSKAPVADGGAFLTTHMVARAVRTAGLGNGTWTGGYSFPSATAMAGYGAQTRPQAMTPLHWKNFLMQVRLGANYQDRATSIRLPSLRNVSAWLQIAAWSVSLGGGEHVGRGGQSGRRFTCLEDAFYNPSRGYTPAEGTVIEGDTVLSQGYSSEFIRDWICVAAGTSRPISTTATTTAGSPLITAAAATDLVPGDFIAIAGVAGIKRVLDIDYATGLVTLDSNATVSVTDAPVTNSMPAWEARWNGKVRLGSGSPSGVVTPDAIGMQYQDDTGPTLYQATGLAASDWVALN